MSAVTGRVSAALVAALVGAAVLGGAVALVGAVALGIGGTTTVREVAATAPAAGAAPAAPVAPGSFSAAGVYAAAREGVVTIDTAIDGQSFAGTGFVVSKDGDVVTAAHVVTDSPTARDATSVRPADEVRVRFADGETTPARIVAYDLMTDVALLHVDPPKGRTLVPLGLADSRAVHVGDPVVALGAPFGDALAGSLSAGVVSGVGRRLNVSQQRFQIPDGIQTDAAINPGDSGGPLLDAGGQVIGMTIQTGTDATDRPGEGISFAIASKLLRLAVDQLRSKGAATWPWLGASLQDIEPGMARDLGLAAPRGVLVNGVQAGGPAAAAGLRTGTDAVNWGTTRVIVRPAGDIIVKVDGTPVATSVELDDVLFRHRPGERVRLDVRRPGGESATVEVELGVRPLVPPR